MYMVSDVALVQAAGQAPEPPSWWLDGEAVKPEQLVPVPEIEPVLSDVYREVAAGRSASLHSQHLVERAQELHERRREAIKHNDAIRARAKFETELKWRAYYAQRLMKALGR